MPIAALVADANVLLSAAIGKAALKVFTVYRVEVHATAFTMVEVEEYLPELAKKYRLIEQEVFLLWSVLKIKVHSEESYQSHLAAARRDLEDRDIDDAHPLALARTLELPVWSNDRDLAEHGVECLPTARLLRRLEQGGDDEIGRP